MKDGKMSKMRTLKEYLEAKGEKVENIKYIGKISKKVQKTEIQDIEDDKQKESEEKDIFMCEEKTQDKNGREIHLIKYYTEDFECIAVENEINGIVPTEKYRKDDEIINKLEELDKEGIIDLEEENLEEIKEVAKTFGVDEKDIENISEIDNLIKPEQKEDQLGKVEDIDAKNLASIDANEKITTRDSMATLLGVEGKKYKKIAVVKSKEMNNTKSTTEFSFVGIKADGKMEQIESLKQIEGIKPTKLINSISADGKEIKEETVYSRYKVKGREDEELAVNIDELNTIRVSLVRTSSETNESVSIPIETNTIVKTSYENKDFMNSIKNPDVTEETRKIEENKHPDLEKNNDNVLYNEEYIPNTNIKWIDFAAQCGYRGKGAIEKAKEVFQEAKDKNGSDDNGEIAEKVVEEKEEDYRPDITIENK